MSTTETLNAKEWLYENYPELTRRLELNTLRNDVVHAMEEFATNAAEQFLAVEREAVGEQVNPEEVCTHFGKITPHSATVGVCESCGETIDFLANRG